MRRSWIRCRTSPVDAATGSCALHLRSAEPVIGMPSCGGRQTSLVLAPSASSGWDLGMASFPARPARRRVARVVSMPTPASGTNSGVDPRSPSPSSSPSSRPRSMLSSASTSHTRRFTARRGLPTLPPSGGRPDEVRAAGNQMPTWWRRQRGPWQTCRGSWRCCASAVSHAEASAQDTARLDGHRHEPGARRDAPRRCS